MCRARVMAIVAVFVTLVFTNARAAGAQELWLLLDRAQLEVGAGLLDDQGVTHVSHDTFVGSSLGISRHLVAMNNLGDNGNSASAGFMPDTPNGIRLSVSTDNYWARTQHGEMARSHLDWIVQPQGGVSVDVIVEQCASPAGAATMVIRDLTISTTIARLSLDTCTGMHEQVDLVGGHMYWVSGTAERRLDWIATDPFANVSFTTSSPIVPHPELITTLASAAPRIDRDAAHVALRAAYGVNASGVPDAEEPPPATRRERAFA